MTYQTKSMNVLHLRKLIGEFFDQLSEADAFIDGLTNLAKYAESGIPPLEGITLGGNRLSDSAGILHGHYANLSKITSKINNRHFFRAIEHLQHSIKSLQSEWSTDSEPFDRLCHETDEFASLYDKYLAFQSGQNAYPLLFLALRLKTSLTVFLELLATLRDSVESQDEQSNSESQFFLVLPERLNLKSFADRLLALQSMYSELCALFDVSEVDHPLRIGNVESGSLWAVLFGNTKIIETMTSFISSGASWAYRNYTVEGKINSLPRKVEAIDAILGLSNRLEASGFDASQMKPNIEKAAINLSKDLTALIEGQRSITINDETLFAQKELSKALLEGRDVRLLAGANPVTLSDPSLPPSEPQGE